VKHLFSVAAPGSRPHLRSITEYLHQCAIASGDVEDDCIAGGVQHEVSCEPTLSHTLFTDQPLHGMLVAQLWRCHSLCACTVNDLNLRCR